MGDGVANGAQGHHRLCPWGGDTEVTLKFFQLLLQAKVRELLVLLGRFLTRDASICQTHEKAGLVDPAEEHLEGLCQLAETTIENPQGELFFVVRDRSVWSIRGDELGSGDLRQLVGLEGWVGSRVETKSQKDGGTSNGEEDNLQQATKVEFSRFWWMHVARIG